MLFFMHIPKAAGTSLRNCLAAALGDRLVPLYEGNREDWTLAARLNETLPTDAVLFGHFQWGIHEHFGQPPRYAAVLRDPVERIVSWYRWMGTHDHLPLNAAVRAGKPLSQLINSDPTLSNGMVEYLAGRRPSNLDDLDTLAAAEKNLRACEFVTVTPNLIADMNCLGRLIGVDISHLPHDNRTDFDAEIDEESLAVVRKYNELDTRLYALAESLSDATNLRTTADHVS